MIEEVFKYYLNLINFHGCNLCINSAKCKKNIVNKISHNDEILFRKWPNLYIKKCRLFVYDGFNLKYFNEGSSLDICKVGVIL